MSEETKDDKVVMLDRLTRTKYPAPPPPRGISEMIPLNELVLNSETSGHQQTQKQSPQDVASLESLSAEVVRTMNRFGEVVSGLQSTLYQVNNLLMNVQENIRTIRNERLKRSSTDGEQVLPPANISQVAAHQLVVAAQIINSSAVPYSLAAQEVVEAMTALLMRSEPLQPK